MPIALPESVKKVLEDKAYGHVVTLNPNGRPQVTMVWMDVEGNEALFNTAEGRKKPQNLRRDRGSSFLFRIVPNRSPISSSAAPATVTETGADATPTNSRNGSSGWTNTRTAQPGEKRLIVRVKVDRLGGIGPKMRPWT